MGRAKNYGAPNPQVYAMAPMALQREIVTNAQVDSKEETIIWGVNNDLPLRILAAVNASPTTTSCLDKVEKFIQGGKFSDEGLMTMVIDKEGTTLWELHQQICHSLAYLEGFTSRFTFDKSGKILNTYSMDMESMRFKRPLNEKSREITHMIHNPYIGTAEYRQEFSKTYNLWAPFHVKQQILQEEDAFAGQVYFYGSIRKPYKFYPVPKYWTGDKWIYVDGGIQEYHKGNIDNGFFISVLLNMIGDPNQPSKNPKYATTKTGTDGVERAGKPSKTVGEEFTEMMSSTFSGAKKAGAVMTMWSLNKEQTPNVEAFPSNVNFDLVSGTFIDTIRGITIATRVPAILANLPQQASSLGSDGKMMKAAIEFMQANTANERNILENFYNNVLFPNLKAKPAQKVKIVNYTPIDIAPEIPDHLWEWMNENEKRDFVKTHYPAVKVDEARMVQPAAPAPGVEPSLTPEQQAAAPVQNEALKNLKVSEINRALKIVKKFENGALTREQAAQLLSSYGFTEEQIKAWLAEELVEV